VNLAIAIPFRCQQKRKIVFRALFARKRILFFDWQRQQPKTLKLPKADCPAHFGAVCLCA